MIHDIVLLLIGFAAGVLATLAYVFRHLLGPRNARG
jgi:hypothetical protein